MALVLLGAVSALLVFTNPSNVGGAGKGGGKIIFAAWQDIADTLDPLLTNQLSTRKILGQVLDTLVAINPQDGKVYPGLAESWRVSKDARTFTFRLRKNVKFQDGTPFNAAAVKFTFDRTLTGAASGLEKIFLGPYEGSDVIDPYTVRVRFKVPNPSFLRMAGLSVLGPVSPTAVQKMGRDFGTQTVIGTGPFMVKEWVKQSHITLVRNPNYNWAPPFAKHQGPAYVDEVEWRVVPEAPTRTAILRTGEVQIAENVSYADVAGLEADPNIRVLRAVPSGTPWSIFPNVQRFPTSELAVRQALALSIDKDAIVRAIFQGLTKPAWSVLLPPTPGYDPVAKGLFPYAPGRARQILDTAGWKVGPDGIRTKDGKRLELLWVVGNQSGYEEMAPLIQAMARKVGIGIQIQQVPFPQMEDLYRKGQQNIAEDQWWFPDPVILSTEFHSRNIITYNRAHLADPAIDKLLDAAAAMGDERMRIETYKKIGEMVIRQVDQIPLVDQVTIIGTRKEVKDYRFSVVSFPVLYDVHLGR